MPTNAPPLPLLNSNLLARLDRLDLLSHKILSGNLRGQHRSPRHAPAASLELADFRAYTPGDDPRFIDWNIYARLDRLLIKLFAQEQELSLYLLIDTSASMDFGTPPKATYAKQLAAALGYVALANQHHLRLTALSDGLTPSTPLLHGRSRLPSMLAMLSALATSGPTDFMRAARQFVQSHRHRGICVILSDFLFKEDAQAGLKSLTAAGHAVHCIQVLSPQELAPTFPNDPLRLTDSEDHRTIESRPAAALLSQYQANLLRHRTNLARTITRQGGTYLFAPTNIPVDKLVLDCLTRGGLLG